MTRSEEPNRHPELDADFTAYARGGDLEALTRVFDAAAPKLALLAAHLVPADGHAVEDLVQTTFLEAIRSAPRFDQGRPVLPWLVTILTRRAADLRRKKGPELTLDAMPEEPPGLEHLDPADLVADDEERERILERIDALGPPYAEVLRLRFVHDFAPGEIARTLGRPVGSVHAQLHRGVQKLRDVLPAALATLLAGALSAESLSVTRQAVIEAARAASRTIPVTPTGTSSSTPWPIASTILMKALVPAVAAIALLWLILDPFADPTPPESIGDPGANREAVLAESAGDSETTTATNRLANAVERSTDAAVQPVFFQGRAIAHESGLPLPEVEVLALSSPPWRGKLGRGSPELVVKTRTDSEGRFRFPVEPNDEKSLTVRLEHPERAMMETVFQLDLRPGGEKQLGEIPMQIGSVLEIEVRDRPVTGYMIQMPSLARGEDPWLEQEDGPFVAVSWRGAQTSDARGLLRSPGPMIPGHYSGAPTKRGRIARGFPEGFEMPKAPGLVRMRVELAAPADLQRTLNGTVVDESGVAVERARIVCTDENGRFSSTWLTSGGHFTLPAPSPESESIQITSVQDASYEIERGYEIVGTAPSAPPGADGIRVVVRRNPGTRYTVDIRRDVDDTNLDEIDLFGAGFRHREDSRPGVYLEGGTFRDQDRALVDGRLELEPLDDANSWQLFVTTDDPKLEPFRRLDLEPEAPGPLELRFRPAVQRRITVVDTDGRPIVGATIETVARVWNESADPRPKRADPILRMGQASYHLQVSSAETDARGQAVLRTGPELARHGFWIRHPRYRPTGLALTEAEDGRTDWRIEMEPSSTLLVRLGPAGELARYGPSDSRRAAAALRSDPERSLSRDRIAVTLVPAEGRRRPGAAVGDDGLAEITHMGEAPFHLKIDFNDGFGEVEFGPYDPVPAGEIRELEIDISRVRPIDLRGVVRLGGELPPRGSRLTLPDRGTPIDLDAQGGFTIRARPGSYEPGLAVRLGGRTLQLTLEQPLILTEASGESVLSIDFPFRRVSLRCVDRSGRPVTDGTLSVIGPFVEYGEGGSREFPVPATGVVRVDGPWRFTARFAWRADAESEWIQLGQLDPPQTPALIDHRLVIR